MCAAEPAPGSTRPAQTGNISAAWCLWALRSPPLAMSLQRLSTRGTAVLPSKPSRVLVHLGTRTQAVLHMFSILHKKKKKKIRKQLKYLPFMPLSPIKMNYLLSLLRITVP